MRSELIRIPPLDKSQLISACHIPNIIMFDRYLYLFVFYYCDCTKKLIIKRFDILDEEQGLNIICEYSSIKPYINQFFSSNLNQMNQFWYGFYTFSSLEYGINIESDGKICLENDQDFVSQSCIYNGVVFNKKFKLEDKEIQGFSLKSRKNVKYLMCSSQNIRNKRNLKEKTIKTGIKKPKIESKYYN